ncbi:translational machinery component [Polychaeton citri CBS 116435]|uniref:Translational machinery component n=1 Tax=Polychaeton citri CBS 116435 TaxID=1314669 RepID=A0A9P4Q909_9PEZI|nr:translational machinery component [Polychaeton citri CBS 116435]
MASPKTFRSFASFVCQSCRQRLLPSPSVATAARRAFTTTTSFRADSNLSAENPFSGSAGGAATNSGRKGFNSPASSPTRGQSFTSILDAPTDSTTLLNNAFSANLDAATNAANQPPHRLHIYSTKHNTHITFVQPPKSAAATASSGVSGTSASATEQKKQIDVLLSLSAGNIGFKKSGRGSYDAAYQLCAFALKQMQEKGMLRDLHRLEVILRGFGAGREACTKVLLGTEGRAIRRYICAVQDATRLKLGGPRSPKPRRLG